MYRLLPLTLFVALAIAPFPAVLHAQFVGLQSEVHVETDLGTTYRIYAEFATASDECVAVYSVGSAECIIQLEQNQECPPESQGPLLLELGVTTAFYQHPAGSNMGSEINPVFFSFFPEMAYDSWLTIGSSSTADEAVSNIGMTADLAEFAAGNGFIMDGEVGGSWYVTPGTNPAALAGEDGLVLLGQFTAVNDTDGSAGHVSCLLNIQWRNASNVSFKETAITLNTAGTTTVSGCMDVTACSYNSSAVESDGSCTYALGCDSCSGETDGSGTVVDGDSDDDGICDADEAAGCQTPTACNYNASATDSATCLFATGCDVCSGSATDGTGTVIDNDADDDGVCDVDEVTGCQNALACNYDASATDAGACTFPTGCETCSGETDGTGTTVANDDDGDGVCNADEVAGCQDNTACNYNAAATDAGEPCVYPTGCESCSGATDGTGTILANDDDGDGVCNADELAGCQNALACNYDPSATDDDGSCAYATMGFNCDGSCLFDDDADGICDQEEVVGCQDAAACNYDASATDSGYCDYPALGYDCTGNCMADADGDGVCDEDEVSGCQDSAACNYDASATDDDDTCTYSTAGFTCDGDCLIDTDSDGVCDQNETVGCQDAAACNYDALATDAGYCDYPALGYDCTGNCMADADGDGVCDADEVSGCQDSAACNYDASATDEDGTCTYATAGYTCDGDCLLDSDGDGICDQNEAVGCQDEAACNYDAAATDAGYCDYAEAPFACDGSCLNDSDGDGICDEFECETTPTENADCSSVEEAFFAALANGDYCGEGTVWVAESNACIPVPTCLGDFDDDGIRGSADLLILLSHFGFACE